MTSRRGLLLLGAMMVCGPAAHAAEPGRWSVGARSAFSASSLNDPFRQLDVFANWDLPAHRPWLIESRKGWYLQTRLDFAAGWLTGQSEDAFVGSVGPTFCIGKRQCPLSFEIGCSPTFLSRHEFRETDFGFPVQFTSHVGVTFAFSPRWSAGYRLQHMSDAGLSQDNPGLDMHSFGLGYRF